MLKKIDNAKLFLEKNAQLFRCPICQADVSFAGYGLHCTNHHQFDLSKKGTLFFLGQGHATEYTNEMFLPRGRMIRSGMYQPVLDQVLEWSAEKQKVLDVGCGEGSFLSSLKEQAEAKGQKSFGTSIGFDLSKEGIYLASSQTGDSFWCVADLTNLPFADRSMDLILNIFTPSRYQEFQRVMKEDGTLIKVIPESGYLKELRSAFFPDKKEKQSYSNEKVMKNLQGKMKITAEKRITYTFQMPQERRLDLLEMSPLEWSVSQERKNFLKKFPLSEITVDVNVIQAKKI